MRGDVVRCDPAFAPVADAFRETDSGGGGAALAVYAGGRMVVDLWQGTADPDGVRRWRRDTVVNVFSVSKGVLATLAHLYVQRGLLDLDAPVARYWPGFATATTIADLLAHRSGLPAVRRELPPGSLFDWDAMTAALAAESPWWTPGERHGYHAVTFGWLVGEVLRRVGGRPLRDMVRDELGVPDLWIGLPAAEARRAAYLAPPQAGPDAPPSSLMNAMSKSGSITMMAFCNPAEQLTPGLPNTARWRAAEIPASNGHATARALATLYGRLVSGAIVGPDVLGRAVAPRSEGRDEVLRAQTRFALGYMLPCEIRPFAPNPRAFGHSGSGGALAFADPDARVALAYTPSRLVVSAAGPDPRWQPMVAALYACL
ncbi:serine hydrolase domain-containing protein [Microbispora bryophytorum]|uniref:Beta-lactamase family protein n=1 Tax=Microbispora bryophytorum subsp. camponoti TaxID=1677852 RepID=A0ABR8L0F6_9ACTN|nr:serine hydrolase domain-containing protein [Microbispora camponoti]MBD3143711.1 beta-lactamase family protein [Microbispora camponoti]